MPNSSACLHYYSARSYTKGTRLQLAAVGQQQGPNSSETALFVLQPTFGPGLVPWGGLKGILVSLAKLDIYRAQNNNVLAEPLAWPS